jgi:signal transduction histidine kinase
VGHTDLWMRPGKALLGASLVGDPGESRPSIGVSGLVQRPWLRLVVRMAGLAVTLWAVLSTLPSGSGRLEPLCTLTVDVLAWLVWAATDGRGRLLAPTLAAMGIAGGITAMSDPSALVFVGVAAGGAAVVWNLPTATVLAAGAPAGFVVAAAVGGSLPGRMLAVGTVSLVGLLAGVARRQIVHQATQATELASAIDQAALARREADLVAERNRLGREMHDLLAHTLGALSIQLTALEALVRSGAGDEALRDEIERIRHLLGEGLDEARQAVRALRQDRGPLVDQLRRLCGDHEASFEISGTPRPLDAEVSLVVLRTAQEALTNAARHAPGAAVALTVSFSPDEVSLDVYNDGSPSGRVATRFNSGGSGYGLVGMRERVLLLGGCCRVGPADGGWRVHIAIPTPEQTQESAAR